MFLYYEDTIGCTFNYQGRAVPYLPSAPPCPCDRCSYTGEASSNPGTPTKTYASFSRLEAPNAAARSAEGSRSADTCRVRLPAATQHRVLFVSLFLPKASSRGGIVAIFTSLTCQNTQLMLSSSYGNQHVALDVCTRCRSSSGCPELPAPPVWSNNPARNPTAAPWV